MTAKELKTLNDDQNKVRKFLNKIGEKDERIIAETIESMRNIEYRSWILKYAENYEMPIL